MSENAVRNRFWDAVRDDDVTVVANCLQRDAGLVSAQIAGEAWVPGSVYDADVAQQVPTPAAFPFSCTALHTAAVHGRSELLSLLLAQGADRDALGFEPNKGHTPAVVLTAWEGNLESLRRLLEHGADPNVPASAETALYAAAEHHAWEKVEMLLSFGARHDVFTAAITGDETTLDHMLRDYPSLSQARSLKRGRTPLEEAQEHGQQHIVDRLGGA